MEPTITTSLESSGEILETLFRHTPVGVVLTDLHGTVLDVNDALCVLVGFPREQLIGQAGLSFVHPGDEAETSAFLAKVRAAKESSRRAVLRLRSHSGGTIWANLTLSVVQSREGEPAFGLVFVEDITERLATDDALRRSASLYRQVVEDQTEMIVRWLPDGTRTFVNEAYARYFGSTPADLIGTSFFPLIVKEDRDTIRAKIDSLTPEQPARTMIHRVFAADGSVCWNEWTDRATFDERGAITILQSVGRDVTDRVKATEALRVSELRYRRLFENLPIPAWEVDWTELVSHLRAQGVCSTEELVQWVLRNPTNMLQGGSRIRIFEANEQALALGGVPDRDAFARWVPQAIAPASLETVLRAIGAIIFDGSEMEGAEVELQPTTGVMRDVLICWNRLRQHGSSWRLLNTAVDVTQRKQSEREILNQKERLEQAEALANLGNWELDAATWTLRGSPQFWRIYDPAGDGRLERSIDEDLAIIHPDDRAAIKASIEAFVSAAPGTAPDVPADREFRIVRPDGGVRWIRSKSRVTARPGLPPLMHGVDQDITDARTADEALRRSEQLYRDLFHNTPIAIWETDWSEALAELRSLGVSSSEQLVEAFGKDRNAIARAMSKRRVVEANQNALKLVGVERPEQILAATWPPKVAPGEVARFVKTLAGVAFGEISKASFEMQFGRSDRSTVDVDVMISCSDAAPGQIVTTAIDVTERKKIERDLLHSQMLLERAQAIARLGSWEISVERNELFGSREYWNLLDGGDSVGPRTRRLSEMMRRVHPDDRRNVWRAILSAKSRFLAGAASDETVVEYRIIRPDGSSRTMRGQGLFSSTPEGDVRGYGIVQDITDILKAEEAVRRQREELMRADRMISLGVLVSGVAHEINNPNQFIMLNAPFLQKAWKNISPVLDAYAEQTPGFRVSGMPWSEMREEIPDIFVELERGSERIRSIVSELRNFGRDHAQVELRPASINEIIEGSLRLLSTHIRRATSNFQISLAPGLPMIGANPQRLEQVIVNLVLNSCQALDRHEAAIRVTTSWHEPSKCVLVEVVDEGKGITPENLAKIRDPFFTTKRAEGGTGLGLAISDRIVEEHGGTLSFESQPGAGTTAIMSLPELTDGEREQ